MRRTSVMFLALAAGAANATGMACFGRGADYQQAVVCVSQDEVRQLGGDVRYAPLLSADTRRPMRRESAALVNCTTRMIYTLEDRGQIANESTFADGSVGAYICNLKEARR